MSQADSHLSKIWIVLAILFTVIAVNVAASASVTYTFQDTYIVNVGDTNVETVKDSFVAVLDNYATTPDTPLYEGIRMVKHTVDGEREASLEIIRPVCASGSRLWA